MKREHTTLRLSGPHLLPIRFFRAGPRSRPKAPHGPSSHIARLRSYRRARAMRAHHPHPHTHLTHISREQSGAIQQPGEPGGASCVPPRGNRTTSCALLSLAPLHLASLLSYFSRITSRITSLASLLAPPCLSRRATTPVRH